MTFEEVSDSDGSISILNSTDRNQESAAECGVLRRRVKFRDCNLF